MGQLLSLGGRLTMINAVLSAVPLYMLSIYQLPASIHRQIDRCRKRFLWQGTSSQKKFALVNWNTICLANEMVVEIP